METIIHIDDQLFNRAQEYAEASGQSMDAFIAESIKETLENKPLPSGEKKYCFPRVRGSELMPGVDISNSSELLDIMEEGLDVSKRH